MFTSVLATSPTGLYVANGGLQGSGTRDDAPGINAFLNSTPVGSAIYFPGNHGVGSVPIILPPNRTYYGPIGDFNGFTFRQLNGSNLPAVIAGSGWYNNQSFTDFPVHLFNIFVDGNSANNSGTHGIVLQNFDCTLFRCAVFNAPQDGIRLDSLNRAGAQSSNGNVQNRCIHCYVNNAGAVGIHVNGSGSNGLTDGYIDDCVIVSTVGTGIQCDHAGGWHFHDNHTSGTNQYGIFARTCWATFITNNYVEGYGDTASAGPGTFYDGIHAELIGSRATTIANNQCYTDEAIANVTYTGISAIGRDGANVMNVICHSNYVVGAGTARGFGYSFNTQGGTTMHVTEYANAIQNVNTRFSNGGNAVFDALQTNDPVQGLASIASGQSSTSPDPTTGGTVTTAATGVARITPAGAETGAILQAGTIPGQEVWVVNESTLNQLSWATQATSHIAGEAGGTFPLAALRAQKFVWDTSTSLWYKAS